MMDMQTQPDPYLEAVRRRRAQGADTTSAPKSFSNVSEAPADPYLAAIRARKAMAGRTEIPATDDFVGYRRDIPVQNEPLSTVAAGQQQAARYGASPVPFGERGIGPVSTVQGAAAAGAGERERAAIEADPFHQGGPASPDLIARAERGAIRGIQQQDAAGFEHGVDQAADQAGVTGRLGANLISGVQQGLLQGVGTLSRLSGQPLSTEGLGMEDAAEQAAIASRADPLTKLAAGLVTYPIQAAANPIVEVPALVAGGGLAGGLLSSAAGKTFLAGMERVAGPGVAAAAKSLLGSVSGLSAMSAASAAGNYPDWATNPEGGLKAMEEAAVHGAGLGLMFGAAHLAPGAAKALGPALRREAAPESLHHLKPTPQVPRGQVDRVAPVRDNLDPADPQPVPPVVPPSAVVPEGLRPTEAGPGIVVDGPESVGHDPSVTRWVWDSAQGKMVPEGVPPAQTPKEPPRVQEEAQATPPAPGVLTPEDMTDPQLRAELEAGNVEVPETETRESMIGGVKALREEATPPTVTQEATREAPASREGPVPDRVGAGEPPPDSAVQPGGGAAEAGPAKRARPQPYSPQSQAERAFARTPKRGEYGKPDLERRVKKSAESLPDLGETELPEHEQQGAGTDHFSGSFPGPIPTELREALAGRPALMMRLRANVPAERRPMGNDVLGSLGVDEYVRRLGEMAKGKVTRGKEAVKNARSYDPEAAFLANLHDRYPNDRPMGVIDEPTRLPHGTTVKIGDELFTIEKDKSGAVLLVPDSPGDMPYELGAFGSLPFDPGTLTVPREGMAATLRAEFVKTKDPVRKAVLAGELKELGIDIKTPEIAPPRQTNLPGTGDARDIEKLTGTQKTMQFETESAFKAKGRTGDDAKIASKFDEEATPTFDTLSDKEDSSLPDLPPKPDDDIPFSPDIADAPSHAHAQPKTMAGPMDPKVGVKDIQEAMERMADVPIRERSGYFAQRKAEGWFNRFTGSIRVRSWTALDTKMHEVGHAIHDRFLGWDVKFPRPVKRELIRMGRELYGTRKPVAGYAREGIAEWSARYMLGDPDLATLFPAATAWMKAEIARHPELAKDWATTKQLFKDWDAQGAWARVSSQIHRDKRMARVISTATKLPRGFYRDWVEYAAPLARAQNDLLIQAGIDPGSVAPALKPYEIMRARRMTSPAIAQHFIQGDAVNLHGRKVGDSIATHLHPVRDRLDQWSAYAVARRNQVLRGRGVEDTTVSAADADYVVKTAPPEFAKALDGVTQWYRHLLDYMVEGGALSVERRTAILKNNPVYVPFVRYFDEGHARVRPGAGTVTTGKGMVDRGSGISRIGGSGEPVVDPLSTFGVQAQSMILNAHKAEVANALALLAERVPKSAWLAEKVQAPQELVKMTVGQARKDLEALGIDTTGVPDDAPLSGFKQGAAYFGPDNIAGFYRPSGKLEFWQFDPEVYKVLKDMDRAVDPDHPALEWAGRIRRSIQLGATGLDPVFTVKNMMRDAVTQVVLGHGLVPGSATIRGLIEQGAGGALSERWKALGLEMSTLMGQDRASARRMIQHAMRTRGSKVIHEPLDAYRAIMSAPEAAPRIAEFERALEESEKKWGKGSKSALIEAMIASKEATIDFTRMGAHAASINRISPFFNAMIQGRDKFWRSMDPRNPRQAGRTFAKGLAFVTAPSMALWLVNKDEKWYRDLPNWRRFGFWNFKVGDTVISIPKPFDIGWVFGSLPEMALDHMYHDGAQSKQQLTDVVYDTVAQLVPFAPASLLATLSPEFRDEYKKQYTRFIPAGLKEGVESLTNHDFFHDAPIVNPFDEMNKPKAEQYGPKTTELSKLIGRATTSSPAKWDHFLSGVTGGLATDVVGAAEWAFGMKDEENTPLPSFLSSMVSPVPAGTNTWTGQNFYDQLGKAKQQNGSEHATLADKRRFRILNLVAGDVSGIRKQVEAGIRTRKAGDAEIERLVRLGMQRADEDAKR